MSVLQQQRRELVRLTIFLVISTLIAVWLGAVMGETRPGDRASYRAAFRDVSGLAVGDQVRVAGVNVGKVDEITVRDDATVLVTFHVREALDLDTSTRAAIKYRNLLGDRILELARPDAPAGGPGDAAAGTVAPAAASAASAAAAPATPLSPGATIPVANTASALDLDTLLNGFKPLFAGLSAGQINTLSAQLVEVLQGQDTAIDDLVTMVGSFATTIGQREQLVGQVIGNLNQVMGTLDTRRGTVGQVIDELSGLITGLERQDTQILDAAGRVNTLAANASQLIGDARGDLHTDLTALGTAAEGLNSRADTLQALLDKLPVHYRTMQDSASYGNFFNFFLCGVRIQLSGRDGTPVQGPWIRSDLERCQR
jgi:phospholipid/cholesterol/gamma-HCH transport system substrate-binding protein